MFDHCTVIMHIAKFNFNTKQCRTLYSISHGICVTKEASFGQKTGILLTCYRKMASVPKSALVSY